MRIWKRVGKWDCIFSRPCPSSEQQGRRPQVLLTPQPRMLQQTRLPEQSQQPRPRLLVRLAGPWVPGVGTQQTTRGTPCSRPSAVPVTCEETEAQSLRHLPGAMCLVAKLGFEPRSLTPKSVHFPAQK